LRDAQLLKHVHQLTIRRSRVYGLRWQFAFTVSSSREADKNVSNFPFRYAADLRAAIITEQCLHSFRQSLDIHATVGEEIWKFPGARVICNRSLRETTRGKPIFRMEQDFG